MIKEKAKVELICSSCNDHNHNWHEAYYEEGAKLIKAEKSYITWCKKVNGYVIENNNYDKLKTNK